MAPAFFQVVIGALLGQIILWSHKLLNDTAGELNFPKFFTFIEQNLSLFSTEAVQARGKQPGTPVTREIINADRAKIQQLKDVLDSIKTRRDKYYAHFDKKYFADLVQLDKDAEIKWGDLRRICDVISEIFNRYSSAYDRNIYPFEVGNIHDIDRILDTLNKCLENQKPRLISP